ncbi:MAG: N-formylglutamate amidohydrolase [Candidatus Cloacimonetes bacterium]|nr:N-formylglutamate amidohydrolase [Candidatus Cloacimonadota bacterium]
MLAEFDFKYDEPIICTAIHNGHELSEKVKENIAISKKTQLYEEDPFTARFTKICNNRIIVNTSRFEVDLNRSREKSIYKLPKDAWGLSVWKKPPSKEIIKVTNEKYKKFYKILKLHLSEMQQKFGIFFVYDIHSYNYRRDGMNSESGARDPEIILGTNNMPSKWMSLVNKVQNDLQNFDFFGRNLDVRINVKFSGGNFSRWIHRNFPDSACCIAIEFKKIFMDEWTGKLDEQKFIQLKEALSSTLSGIKSNLVFPDSID